MIEWHDYFQIATLILLFLLTMGRAIHLRLTQSINPIKLGMGKKRSDRVVEICLFLGLALWAIVVFSFALHLEVPRFLTLLNEPLLGWRLAKPLGAILLACSLVLFILALVSFGNSWRVGIDEKTPGELVSRGVFAVTRNPIFLSLIVYAIGTFLINGSLILLVFAILIVAGVRYQIIQEEKFLLVRYGKAYEEYKTTTGRYIRLRRSSRA